MKNKYLSNSHISEKKFRDILKFFCIGLEAKKVAELTLINRNSINRIFKLFRQRILDLCEYSNPLGVGEIEIDESYFGAKRTRGKRGRGANGKTPVFGMLKRHGKVYTQIVSNCSANQLVPILKGQVDIDSTIFSDSFRTYDGLADFGYKKHYRIKHGNNEFAKKQIASQNGKQIKVRNHINGIENFWGLAKTRLSRFRGIHKTTFKLHLKECEFRFNNRKENLYKILLKNFRDFPL